MKDTWRLTWHNLFPYEHSTYSSLALFINNKHYSTQCNRLHLNSGCAEIAKGTFSKQSAEWDCVFTLTKLPKDSCIFFPTQWPKAIFIYLSWEFTFINTSIYPSSTPVTTSINWDCSRHFSMTVSFLVSDRKKELPKTQQRGPQEHHGKTFLFFFVLRFVKITLLWSRKGSCSPS